MAKKDQAAGTPEPSEEQQELEKRVDAMLDPSRPEPKAGSAEPQTPAETLPTAGGTGELPPLDIFKDMTSAPAVKKVAVKFHDDDTPQEPKPAKKPKATKVTKTADTPKPTKASKPKKITVTPLDEVDDAPPAENAVPAEAPEEPDAEVPAQTEESEPAGAPVVPDIIEFTRPRTSRDPEQTTAAAPEESDGTIDEEPEPSDDESAEADASPELPETPEPATEPTEPDTTQEVPDDEAEPLPAEPLDDSTTDAAIKDITAKESDTVLAVEDAAAEAAAPQPARRTSKRRGHRKWWLIALLVVIVAAVLAVPATRYKVLGFLISRDVTVTVVDSVTGTPVSAATLSSAGRITTTDGDGKAVLSLPVGPEHIKVDKKYYRAETLNTDVPVIGKVAPLKAKLTATGLQVSVAVVDKISGDGVSGAKVDVAGTGSLTGKDGKATVVVPAGKASLSATIDGQGYNTLKASIIPGEKGLGNRFELVPAGHIYSLHQRGGGVDVVRTNVDGSDPVTIVKGTGNEDPADTYLLASRDWKYLVLKAHRDTSRAALYLIDTATGKLTDFDSSNADFKLIGWDGHHFMYDVISHVTPQYKTGNEALKSYDAAKKAPDLLDQSLAEGNDSTYAYQDFSNFFTLGGQLVYTASWHTYSAAGTSYDLSSKTNVVRGVRPSGDGKTDYQAFAASSTGNIQAVQVAPAAAEYGVYDYTQNKTIYYRLEDGSFASADDIHSTDFNRAYPNYIVSPSGNKTFWNDAATDVPQLGDAVGNGGKALDSATGYTPYGWLSDKYLLLRQDGNLFIMGTNGSKPQQIGSGLPTHQRSVNNGYEYGGV